MQDLEYKFRRRVKKNNFKSAHESDKEERKKVTLNEMFNHVFAKAVVSELIQFLLKILRLVERYHKKCTADQKVALIR